RVKAGRRLDRPSSVDDPPALAVEHPLASSPPDDLVNFCRATTDPGTRIGRGTTFLARRLGQRGDRGCAGDGGCAGEPVAREGPSSTFVALRPIPARASVVARHFRGG